MTARRQYGRALDLRDALGVPLYSLNGENLAAPTLATGDVKVSKDGAAEGNIATLPTMLNGVAQVQPSATEMACQRFRVKLVDQDATKIWADEVRFIETENHPDAMHPNGVSHYGIPQAGSLTNLQLATLASTLAGEATRLPGMFVTLRHGGLTTVGLLAIDAAAEKFKTTQTDGALVAGVRTAIAAGTAKVFSAAHEISADKFGIILVQRNAAGTYSTKVPLATQAYDDAAAALAAKPAPDSGNIEVGHIAIENNGSLWTANTDDLTNGSDVTTASFVDGALMGGLCEQRVIATYTAASRTCGLNALRPWAYAPGTAVDEAWVSLAPLGTLATELAADLLAEGLAAEATVAALTLTAIADAILDRDMATGTDSGSTTVRTPRQALRALRNKVSVAGGTATITKEDDSTASWTAAVTCTPAVTGIDPAGP